MSGIIENFKEIVKDYKIGRATLRFGLDKEIPLALLEKLIFATKVKNEQKK